MVKIGAYFVVRRHCVMDHFRQAQNGMQMHPPHDPKAIGVEAIVTAILTSTLTMRLEIYPQSQPRS